MAMVFKIINFAIFAAVLYLLVKRPVREFLSQRSRSMSEVIAAAKNAFENARSEESKWAKRTKDAEVEITKIVEGFRKDGELERKRIIEQADRYAKQMAQDAGSFAKNETLRAVQEIKRIAAEETAGLVASKFAKETTGADQMLSAERAAREISENL